MSSLVPFANLPSASTARSSGQPGLAFVYPASEGQQSSAEDPPLVPPPYSFASLLSHPEGVCGAGDGGCASLPIVLPTLTEGIGGIGASAAGGGDLSQIESSGRAPAWPPMLPVGGGGDESHTDDPDESVEPDCPLLWLDACEAGGGGDASQTESLELPWSLCDPGGAAPCFC